MKTIRTIMRAFTLALILILIMLAALSCDTTSNGGDKNSQDDDATLRQIIFVVEGEEYARAYISEEGTALPKSPQKEACVFAGWYYDSGSWQKPLDTDSPELLYATEDVFVYARFFDEYENDGIMRYYVKEDNTYLVIIEPREAVTSVTVPAERRGLPVSEVGYVSGYDKSFVSYVTEVSLPDSLTAIGDKAFQGFSSLMAIDIPEGVSRIGQLAFAHCSSLTELSVPDATVKIGRAAFEGCIKLESLSIPFLGGYSGDTENCYLSYLFGGSKYKDNATSVPDSVTTLTVGGDTVADYSFYGCNGLSNLTLTGNPTSIGASAFYGCSWIYELTIPESVESIGDAAFSGCRALVGIEFPESVKKIGRSAFFDCRGLTEVTVPSTVTEIGFGAFSSCTSLRSIVLPFLGERAEDTQNNFFGYLFGADTYSHNASTVPEHLTSVKINGGTLGKYAFYECAVTDVELDSVSAIGNFAFSLCNGLTRLILPSGLESIGERAFSNCALLNSVVIPDSVQSLGANVFYSSGSTGVFTVYFCGTKGQWDSLNDGNFALPGIVCCYYSESEPISSGSFWHYGSTGEPEKWQ